MKKIISMALVVLLVMAGSVCAFAGTSPIGYNDWDSKHTYPLDTVNTKYHTAVKMLVDKKAIEGYEDGLFHPERSISRAEMAKILLIITNNTGNMALYEKNNTFSDLGGHSWAKGYINTAAALGIINGVGNGKFNPGGEVTYAEAMAMIVRLLDQVKDSDLPGTWPNNYINYVKTGNRTGTVQVSDWNAFAQRGDIALILDRNI
ncbi:MAG: S-layer homology domain-containing protein [Eubacteriales bacterium]|nr:S-layer homology domain-containing protein [Eubacteriales bacterium]MDD4390249.1 S-layer homology domain-containing protein [Eubacteriales bacterium]